ncbi:type VI secretion system baseplate subunit TssG [Burkholderia sp. Bp8963]|uniref:type VI secretion system baseplate subunit TssG n=1 Tax=Burkholderia sp. Bp8963 TaxID=2184547 RepID=UPI000F5935A5|nr:type VI secretion system baseplate subunit TssG [Burkholderia sp. Bp8963]RQS72306.1 type VI secretion system baseplate subunit TssG [Burkholderia sp. Bp8963]
MQAPDRRIDPGVVDALLDEPHRFEFFQAVRVLEGLFARQASDAPGAWRHGDIVAQRIAFRNSLSLSFPASEIERLRSFDESGALLDDDDGARDAALAAGELGRVELTPAFFGLLGGQGALPLHYTEQIVAREYLKRDHAARAFFDVFSNRATALFYSAWKKYRLPFHYELDRDERYLPLLLAIAGVTSDEVRDSLQAGAGGVLDEAVAGYALAARHRPMSAAYLQRTLSDYFRVPVKIDQFVGKWYDVPPDQLSVLGEVNAVLGATALVGERVWQRDMRARLVVGPLSKRDYEAFLPGGAQAVALERMLTLLAGLTLEYEVSLVLKRSEVGASVLGAGARLGWDAFLCTRDAAHDRADARYELHVIH